MFDFDKFYKGLLERTDYSSNYWAKFPKHQFQFKSKTLHLLKENAENKDDKALDSILAIIFYDGADKEYTAMLLQLLDADWHIRIEDIVSVLEVVKDPASIDKLYEVAVNVPDYDEMRSLAKKCIAALGAINTPASIEKLVLLKHSDDALISENAASELEYSAKQ